MKPGTRAWDGLLEALCANLIAALFLNGMFSCAVWKARPLKDVHDQRDAASQCNGSCLRASEPSERLVLWLVVVVGVACASADSEHGVVRGAGNSIKDKGAVALAAALQGNTTLQTLILRGMSTARTRVFKGMGGRSQALSTRRSQPI